MTKVLIKLLVFSLLGFYLLIPFKSQFIQSFHFVSHLAKSQNHHHHHGSEINDHSHSFLEVVKTAIDEQQNHQQLPPTVSSFKFQTPFPSDILQLPSSNTISLTIIAALNSISLPEGPSFEVHLPPP